MDALGQQVVNALSLGILYGLLSLSVSLSFSTMGFANFAVGEFATLGAFAGLVATKHLSLESSAAVAAVSCLAAIFVGLLASVGAHRVVFANLRPHSPLLLIVASAALSLFIREILCVGYPNGANPHPFPTMASSYRISSSLFVPLSRLYVILISASGLLFFYFALHRTRIGLETRALVADRELATSCGINCRKIYNLSAGASGALCGLSGVAYASTYGVIQYDMGAEVLVKGFIAALIGGFSILGAIPGGLVLGAIETVSSGYLPGGANYREIWMLALVSAILMLRWWRISEKWLSLDAEESGSRGPS